MFVCLLAGLFVCSLVWLFVCWMVFVSSVFCFMWLFVRSGGSWLDMSGWGSLGNSAVPGLGFTESALWSKLAKKRPVARRPAPGWKGDASPRPGEFFCQLFVVG